jgi:hypothetical protein
MNSKINNIETLSKFQNELNNIINREIGMIQLHETVESIPNLPFYKMVSLFESIEHKMLDSKKGKSLLKKYIKTIKESKDLKSLYELRNFLNEGITSELNESVGSDVLLNELIKCYETVDFKNLDENTNKLGKIISEAVTECACSKDEILNILNNDDIILESFGYVVTNKKSLKNISEYMTKFAKVSNFLSENAKTSVVLDENFDAKNVSSDINEVINDASEKWERDLAEKVTLFTLSNRNMSELFEEYKNDCLNKINEIIEDTADIAGKSRFTAMKENLEKKTYDVSRFSDDISVLAELKNTLFES